MAAKRKYKYNPKTLSFEASKARLAFVFDTDTRCSSCEYYGSLGYYMLYTEAFKLKTPRTIRLEREYKVA